MDDAALFDLAAMKAAVRYNKDICDHILEHCVDGRVDGCVLDFGAGIGIYADLIRERGCGVVCVDIEPTFIDKLRGNGHVVYSAVSEVEKGSISAVYLINVLEHIENDSLVLTEIVKSLQVGTPVFIYVPALPILFSAWDERVGHFRRYTKSSLTKVAQAAGLGIINSEYADSLGAVVTLGMKVVSHSGKVSENSIRTYDTFVYPISRLVDRVFSGALPGKNVWVKALVL